mmetsp:Transcript_91147/g.262908  ORF Transcript_91147/g.262908 Transcript_91147/m.262908 type:complete len:253 (+) Transcript_91147:376-1134(+)
MTATTHRRAGRTPPSRGPTIAIARWQPCVRHGCCPPMRRSASHGSLRSRFRQTHAGAMRGSGRCAARMTSEQIYAVRPARPTTTASRPAGLRVASPSSRGPRLPGRSPLGGRPRLRHADRAPSRCTTLRHPTRRLRSAPTGPPPSSTRPRPRTERRASAHEQRGPQGISSTPRSSRGRGSCAWRLPQAARASRWRLPGAAYACTEAHAASSAPRPPWHHRGNRERSAPPDRTLVPVWASGTISWRCQGRRNT